MTDDPNSITDPFGVTPDREAYVPRRATEDALIALERFVLGGATAVALTGPTGIGKTLLLRVLATRLASHLRTVHVPYSALPANEISAWILGLMGETAGAEPDRELAAVARRLEGEGKGLAILVDDAGSMPIPTVQRLAEIAAEAHGALHVVVALLDDPRAETLIQAIGAGTGEVHFDTPMDATETGAYVRVRFARAGISHETRARFDAVALQWVQRESGGSPRLVNDRALEWLRRISGLDTPGSDELGESNASVPTALTEPSPATPTHASQLAATPTPRADAPARDRGPESAPARQEPAAPEPIIPVRRGPDPDPPRATPPDVSRNAAPAAPAAPAARKPRGPRRLTAVAAVAAAAVFAAVLLAVGFAVGRLSPDLWRVPSEGGLADAGAAAFDGPELEPVTLPFVSTAPPAPSPMAGVGVAVSESALPDDSLGNEVSDDRATAADASAANAAAPVVADELESAVGAEGASTDLGGPVQIAALPAPEVPPSEAPVPTEPVANEATPGLVPKPVRVNVNAKPWARISVDGVEVGITPLAGLELSEGSHRFRAELPDGRIVERDEAIDALNQRVIFR